jgi:hypothetical protein
MLNLNWNKIIWISEILILASSYLAVYFITQLSLENETNVAGQLGFVFTQFFFVTNILQLILFRFSFLEKCIRYSFVALQVIFLTFGNWIYSEPTGLLENYSIVNGYKLILMLSAFYFAFTLTRLISNYLQMPVKDITRLRPIKKLKLNPNA